MKYALIIGNNNYSDPRLAQLKTPAADSRALADVLRDKQIGGFDEVIPVINQTEAEVRRAIGAFFSTRRPDDLVLVYFSGHGVLDDRGRLYLALQDTQAGLLKATAIPSSFIADEMDGCRSRRQILILDCCHSGAFERGTKGEQRAVTEATFEGSGFGRVVLTASDSTQYALEGDQVISQTDLSLFTHFLLKGLKTGHADADNDGYVSLDEWYDYAYDQVLARTPKQVPHKWSYRQQGDLIIAKNPFGKPEEKNRKRTTMTAIPRQPAPRKAVIAESTPTPVAVPISAKRRSSFSILGYVFAAGLAAMMAAFICFALALALFRGSTFLWAAPTLTLIPTLESTLTLTVLPQGSLINDGAVPTLTGTPTPFPEEIKDGQNAPMRLIPTGEFSMGNFQGDSQEQPVHTVFLDDFYIDKFEVTNALYKLCVDAGNCHEPNETSRYDQSRYADHPVLNVDWNQARIFCDWRDARLPTEAEWEKAARGTDSRTYPWGEVADCSHANYFGCVGDTSPVGSYENGQSVYGVYDMAGNAWEWVADWYGGDYYSLSPSSNPQGPASGDQRALRGGSWLYNAEGITTYVRHVAAPTLFDDGLGFRCARDATP